MKIDIGIEIDETLYITFKRSQDLRLAADSLFILNNGNMIFQCIPKENCM